VTWLLANWKVLGGAAVLGLALALYVQTVRLGAAQAEREAALAQLQVLGKKVEAQNQAVQRLEAEGKARAAAAAQAAARARQQAAGLGSQVDALQALLDAQGGPGRAGACPAGNAVKDVRRALAGQ